MPPFSSGQAIIGVQVGVLKLPGGAVALAAVADRPECRAECQRLLGVAVGAFGLLSLYSAGNPFITVGAISGPGGGTVALAEVRAWLGP